MLVGYAVLASATAAGPGVDKSAKDGVSVRAEKAKGKTVVYIGVLVEMVYVVLRYSRVIIK